MVGKVDRILVSELKKTISRGTIPVIAPIGVSKEGAFLNINADVVAGKVAESLKAEKLILLTDIKGIIEKNKVISRISAYKGKQLINNNTIQGGMTPKVTAALEAKKNGVNYVSFGSFFKSKTKKTTFKPTFQILRWAKKKINMPTVGIGGINSSNYKKILSNGANFVACSNYVWNNKKLDPVSAISKFK